MMRDLLTKLQKIMHDDAVRGIAPWAALIAGAIVLQVYFSYWRVPLNANLAGLEPNTMYLINKRSALCVGDIGRFRDSERRVTLHRRVAAKGGQRFSLNQSGYRIDRKEFDADKTWISAAKTVLGERGERSIPSGAFLFINDAFDPASKVNNWPFQIIEARKTKGRISHTLFSRDLSKIGQPIGNADPACVRKTVRAGNKSASARSG